MPDDESQGGLAATLLRLAIDAPMLVERVETDTQWVGLEDAAEFALGGAEEVVAVITVNQR